MRRIDEPFLKYPFYGARRMALHLRREGVRIGRRRAARLMRLMGLQAIYRAPRTSDPHPEHRISMDGRGRCMDNIFIERLWRSLKYEAIYLHEIADGFSARRLIRDWVRFHNLERPHLALDGRTPAEAYRGEPPVDMMDKPLRALPTGATAAAGRSHERDSGGSRNNRNTP